MSVRGLGLIALALALAGCGRNPKPADDYVFAPVTNACRLIAALENPSGADGEIVVRELDVSEFSSEAFRKALKAMPGHEVHVWMPGASRWLLVGHLTTNRVSLAVAMEALALDESCESVAGLFANYAGTREEILPAFNARLEGTVVPEWFVTRDVPRVAWLDERGIDPDILSEVRSEMRTAQVVRRLVLEGNMLAAKARNREDEEKATDTWARAMMRNPRELLLRERIDRLERNARGFLEVGKLLQVMKCYETVMLIQPDNLAAVHNFALCLKRLGKVELADKALKKVGLRRLTEQFREAAAKGDDASDAADAAGETVANFIGFIRDDGSFSDLSYQVKGKERGTWKGVNEHLKRLCALAADWYRAPSYRVERAIHQTLGWWFKNDPVNPNWWWNEIGAPQQLGKAALIAAPVLTAEERSGVVSVLRRADGSKKRTGQNRVWLERIRLMRAMLIADPGVADYAIKSIMEEVKVSDGEGVKRDGSFHQHGPQPQLGNYGLSYLLTMLSLAEEFTGTPWQFSEKKFDILRLLARDGYRWVGWKGMMDVSSMNRQIMPHSQRRKGRIVERALAKMRKLDPTFPKEDGVGFRFFNESAYAIYRTANWMASVKMHTPGIKRTETWVNDENTKGVALCDGALYVYSTGREYEEIFPLWDWRMIPGTTGRRGLTTKEDPKHRAFNRINECRGWEEGGNAFVEWKMDKEGVVAEKRWTFANDRVIAEGKRITSKANEEIVTTVEQALAQPNVKVYPYSDGVLRVRNGDFEYAIEAPEKSVHAVIEERRGDYRDFNLRNPSHHCQGKVLTIWISHGIKPKNATYKYTITHQPLTTDH